jgi:TonB family protein
MRAIVIVGAVLVAAGAGLGAQDPLSAAKDLYASAAYEDALSTLSRLDGSTTPDIARQADEYRAFCLYALGRTREAESVAESMIRKQPLARLDAADASPRLEMMFAEVRKRMLPSLIRERFRTARSALDQKSFSIAEPSLTEARLMIVEADRLGVKDDGLGDLSILVDGFLQLIRSTAEQRASAQPAPAAVPVAAAAAPVAPRPAVPSPAASRPAAAPPAASRPAAASPAPAPAVASGPRVYSVDDEGVTPPVTIDQRMPAMTTEMEMITKAMKTSGIVDIVIDESGRVIDAVMRQSLNSSFDTMVVRTARRWKYQPAMKDGVAVRYLKTLILVP